jgi:hypothetical protein
MLKALIDKQQIEKEKERKLKENLKRAREHRAKIRLKQQEIRLLEEDNGEIVRKKYAKAWQKYDVNSTIEALYSKSFKKHSDFEIYTSLNTYISLSPKFPIKSMALVQEADYSPSLIAFFRVKKETLVDYGTKIILDSNTSKSNYSSREIYSFVKDINCSSKDIYAFVEDISGDIFLWRHFNLSHNFKKDFCRVDDMLNTYKQLKYEQHLSVKKIEDKVKVKTALSKEGLLKTYIHIYNKSVSYVEAKRKEIPVQFISHIQATLNEEVVFDYYLSPFIDSKRTEFTIENVKEGDVLDVFVEDVHGQKIHKSVVVTKGME